MIDIKDNNFIDIIAFQQFDIFIINFVTRLKIYLTSLLIYHIICDIPSNQIIKGNKQVLDALIH